MATAANLQISGSTFGTALLSSVAHVVWQGKKAATSDFAGTIGENCGNYKDPEERKATVEASDFRSLLSFL